MLKGMGTEPDARGGKECSQFRHLTGSLMFITSMVHVYNHQSYAHSLWQSRQLFVQICGVAGGQTKALARAQRQAVRWTLGITLGSLTCVCMGCSCTHTGWALSTQRAQALSNSCRSPMTLMWFWGSRSRTDRNYAHWWQRMEMYVLHMHDCVQLLASMLFIMACVSDPALEIQIRMIT